MTRHEKTLRTLTRQWRDAVRAEESATDITHAWKLAARTDAARRRLDSAKMGIVPVAPRTRRNLAIGGFFALAAIGRAVARAITARAALAKAHATNAARRVARSMRAAARRALRTIVLAVIALAPSVALAHPGHDGHDGGDINAGGGVVLVGLTLGLAGYAWAQWGDRRRALASADSGRPMAGGSNSPESAPEPESKPEPDPFPPYQVDPLAPYYTVRIPYVHAKATRWHPTTNVGPFSTLTRGCHPSLEAARAWADSHLDGHPYSVALVEYQPDGNDDRVTVVHVYDAAIGSFSYVGGNHLASLDNLTIGSTLIEAMARAITNAAHREDNAECDRVFSIVANAEANEVILYNTPIEGAPQVHYTVGMPWKLLRTHTLDSYCDAIRASLR